jgi:hypothetical protein
MLGTFLVFALAVAFTVAGVIGCGVGPARMESIVTYGDGERTFEGVMVVPRREADKKRPAVVIVHDFLGLADYRKAVARRLADKGYVVLAPDIYEQGVRPRSSDEANQRAFTARRCAHDAPAHDGGGPVIDQPARGRFLQGRRAPFQHRWLGGLSAGSRRCSTAPSRNSRANFGSCRSWARPTFA